MDDATLPSHPSIPLISRLDHLEFIMKYLERKQKWGSNACAEKQCMPLDLALKETCCNGSLLDRVASLEHRLFQLCLEMDSSCSSYPFSRASTQTSGESSSSQGSKREVCISLPTFNNLANHEEKGMPQNHIDKLGLQEKSESVQHQIKKPSPPKQQVVKDKPKRNEKKSKGGKKRMPPNWPHFKLLGC